ncbi:MAG: thiamine pyrophosphate-dependent enzyme [Anaerovoracaceae bacterium]|jgi:2-oxoglutarate ferredoxin oxidoreductase subunit beta
MAEVIYERTKFLTDKPTHYCPGCTHGLEHKIIGEVLEELGVLDRTIMLLPVGCTAPAYDYANLDSIACLHGRAPATGTGVKAALPDSILYIHQGDGDLLSIGLDETISAASRGENFTVVFANNNIYGMTGGQMAATTLIGQKATTCPRGRDPKLDGYPVGACELINTLTAPKLVARTALYDIPHINQTKKVLKKAFQNQIDGKGYSFVEILSTCPTNWHMSPQQAMEHVKTEMEEVYPLGIFRDED